MGRRQRFSKDFKLEAVRLLELGQKPAAQLALELGVRRNQLYKWKEQLAGKGEAATSSSCCATCALARETPVSSASWRKSPRNATS